MSESRDTFDLPRAEVVRAFLDRHSISGDASPFVEALETAIYWTDATLLLLQAGFANGTSMLLEDDPTSGLLFNMLNRNFEAVDGAIVAFISECGPTSELSSRAAIEFSASIMYILQGDRRLRLLAYFDDYIRQGLKQVKTWRIAADALPVPARDEHLRAARRREEANESLSQIVEMIRVTFGAMSRSRAEDWPSVAARFEAIGRANHYRTVYARLSSQTHSDAEETLRYFVSVIGGSEELATKMALETVEYTRMMVLFAVSDFIRASMIFASIDNWSDCIGRLRGALDELDAELSEVSSKIGAA